MVKPPAHRDPKHVCRLPYPWPGIQVGHGWICDLERGSGCGNHWTWTGDGWTEWQHPAGFVARRKLENAWLGASRDLHVQPSLGSGVLRSPLEVQNDLQRRIGAYAARRPEPNALRQLRQLALANPSRADAILKRNGY